MTLGSTEEVLPDLVVTIMGLGEKCKPRQYHNMENILAQVRVGILIVFNGEHTSSAKGGNLDSGKRNLRSPCLRDLPPSVKLFKYPALLHGY